MIISIMFANEKNLSCLEGLIVQEKKINIVCTVLNISYGAFLRGTVTGTFQY